MSIFLGDFWPYLTVEKCTCAEMATYLRASWEEYDITIQFTQAVILRQCEDAFSWVFGGISQKFHLVLFGLLTLKVCRPKDNQFHQVWIWYDHPFLVVLADYVHKLSQRPTFVLAVRTSRHASHLHVTESALPADISRWSTWSSNKCRFRSSARQKQHRQCRYCKQYATTSP